MSCKSGSIAIAKTILKVIEDQHQTEIKSRTEREAYHDEAAKTLRWASSSQS
jgi:hypothetical protein